jgi:hypothetical protein
MAKKLLLGHPVTNADMVAEGRTRSLLSVIVGEIKRAGYEVEQMLVDDPNRPGRLMTRYRVTGRHSIDDALRAEAERAAGPSPVRTSPVAATRPPREPRRPRTPRAREADVIDVAEVVPHPELGTALTVKVLALTDDHGLVMHLHNGSAVWQVAVIGHVPR